MTIRYIHDGEMLPTLKLSTSSLKHSKWDVFCGKISYLLKGWMDLFPRCYDLL